MDYRQLVVNAAIAELQSQLDAEHVQQTGTHVEVEGTFKMARVVEASLRAALTKDQDALIAVVIRALQEERGTHDQLRDEATDLLYDICHAVVSRLDPLP